MLSLFPVACSKLGAVWFSAEVNATELNTLISAVLPTVAPSKHNINPPAAVIALRFDVRIMHPSHEINYRRQHLDLLFFRNHNPGGGGGGRGGRGGGGLGFGG
jgi:hypothetical protein